MLWGAVGLLAAGAAAYHLAASWTALRFQRQTAARGADVGLVSILKPVGAPDSDVARNVAAHLAQSYPRFEVIAASPSPLDGLPEDERLRQVTGPPPSADTTANPKVLLLEAAFAEASGDVIVLTDADVRVGPEWLGRMVAPLADPRVGMTTCLYRARPGGTFASRLDALWIAADFPGQVLMADALQGVRFGLGAAIAVRRSELEAVGGFAAIRPYLADDYQLGASVAAMGRRVELSREVVETAMGSPSWGDVWRRHVRWSRTIRASRPAGHLGLVWTKATVWGLLSLVGPWRWIGAAALTARAVSALTVSRAVGAGWVGANLPLVYLADLGAWAAWLAGLFGREVEWRGRTLRLDGQGRLVQ